MKNSLTKNYAYNLIYQILILVLPLVTTPYLSKTLGAENIGIYSYTLSITTYFILFGSLGVAMYGQREIAYKQDDKYNRSKTFWEILLMRFITLGFSMMIFFFTCTLHGNYAIYYKILLLEIFANAIDISWFFQGIEEFKKTITRNSIIKIISVICIFLFIKNTNDLVIYFIIYVLSNLLGNLSLWIYLPKFVNKVTLKDLNIFKHVKPNILLFIPQIAIQIYTVLDKTMIGVLLKDMTEVGNYEQSQRLSKFPLTIVTALGTVMIPRMANSFSNNKKGDIERYIAKSFDFVWLIGIPLMLGMMSISYNIVPWFLGEGFEKSKLLIVLGSPLIMAIGLNNVSGMQYLIPTNRQNIFTKSVVIGAIFNFVTNLILIPIFKSKGAIITSVLAEIIIFIIQLFYIRKEISLKIVYNNCFKCIAAGIIMATITTILGFFMKPTITTTLVQVIVGGICYITLLLVFKEKLIFEILHKAKTKLWRSK